MPFAQSIHAIESQYSFENIIGKSKPMRTIFHLIKRISTTDVNVVITGASGTGKELFARAIHFTSHRKDKPFIAVECAAIPETLLEAELFGYMKGAFTDAKRDKTGLMLEANEGSLFLDDVNDLPLSLQAKLLRAIQEGEIRPLGSTRTIPIDVRIIAASNEDLQQLVKAKRFREDLFYRLNVLNILLPPLIERKEDIILLVEHFIKKFAVKMKKNVSRISEEALRILMDHEWPGNVRELQNTIERAVALAKSAAILENDIPENIRSPRTESGFAELFEKPVSLKELEQKYILAMMERFNGNKVKVSKLLSIDRKTLYNKLSELKEEKYPAKWKSST